MIPIHSITLYNSNFLARVTFSIDQRSRKAVVLERHSSLVLLSGNNNIASFGGNINFGATTNASVGLLTTALLCIEALHRDFSPLASELVDSKSV